MQIGVPRALLYYNYFPAIEEVLTAIGADLVLSPPTNKTKLEQGLAASDDEVCLPVKVLMGHVNWLVDCQVDVLLLPRVVSVETKRYICPKFLGLPDIVRAHLAGSVPIWSPTINLGWSRLRLFAEGLRSSRPWLTNPLHLWQGFHAAAREQRRHQLQLAAAFEPQGVRNSKRVAVLGHSYNLYDGYINHDLLSSLNALGVATMTLENFPRSAIEEGARVLAKDLFWSHGRDIVGAACYCLEHRIVDGVILVVSFGCGPDSLVKELIERRYAQASLPLMSIILDEHSSDTGLATRLEAYVDLLNWRDLH